MKALSLTQPWAWLVVHAGKDVENRRWNTRFRGEFLVHAAKGMRAGDYDAAFDTALSIGGASLAGRIPEPKELQRGGIVGVAELFNVQPPLTPLEKARRLEQWTRRGINEDPWHFHDQFGFRLRNVRPLPFLPCAGALSFWGNFAIREGKAVQL
jgi:hypothetical protein